MGRSNKLTPVQGKVTNPFDHQIQTKMRNLHEAVHQADDRRVKFNEQIEMINNLHEKVGNISDLNDVPNQQKTRLRKQYDRTLESAKKEADQLRKALAMIEEIRKLKNDKRLASRQSSDQSTSQRLPMRRGALMVMLQAVANTMPLWCGDIDEHPPPLCGALPEEPAHLFKEGDAVAALVQNTAAADDEDAPENNWILGEVIFYQSGTSKYEIEDIDEEQNDRHLLSKKKLIALPRYRANPTTDPKAIFPVDSLVLALYPQTTCFYKGVVEQRPEEPTDDYLIAFEDQSFDSGYSPPMPVPQRYVLNFRDVK